MIRMLLARIRTRGNDRIEKPPDPCFLPVPGNPHTNAATWKAASVERTRRDLEDVYAADRIAMRADCMCVLAQAKLARVEA